MSNFKVGDWVIWKNTLNSTELTYIKSAEDAETFNVFGGKLWQPKEGEWCWFYNSSIERWFISKWENSSSQLSALWHKTCEPFVGELPSFLKDKR